ncbi:MAG TPA: (2Fe-2S)-binding protein [Stellaceae bacterium]|nr:(2Fe-2S)-binding protein [Stellaceae bacterium]
MKTIGNGRIDDAVERGALVDFTFDGVPLRGYPGESLATALFVSGITDLRKAPRSGTPRGMFCLMGICQECVVWIEGRRQPSCQVTLRDGLQARSGTIAGLES